MKLPAYGKELLDVRRRSLRPAPPFDAVFVTDSWEIAKRVRDWDFFAMVCEPPEAPYDFSALFDLPVIVMVVSPDQLGLCERIARAQPSLLKVPPRWLWWKYWCSVVGVLPREDLAVLTVI